ncbi:MAG: ABC transporter permease [Streptosporangiaceae bacterium]|jgi:peptide/nickel transport system permease protein
MSAYLLRRLGTSIVILIGISIFIFGMLHIIFPSPAIIALGPRANSVLIKAWNREHGYDKPAIVQYLDYMKGLVFHHYLGYSYKLNQSVAALFQERWARSAYLSGTALVLSVLIAVPLGIYQAVKRNTLGDNAATTVAFVLYAMPDFFLYLIAIAVFALTFHLFSYEASQSTSVVTVVLDVRAMALPILSLTALQVAGYSRYMRSSAMDSLAQDYIKAARAKGLPERLVLLRHLVRNACLPMVTLIGLSIPALLSGNLIAEVVFNYQGLGLLFYDSLQNEDYTVLLAYTLLGALLTVAGNLVADVALTVADPRIRLS